MIKSDKLAKVGITLTLATTLTFGTFALPNGKIFNTAYAAENNQRLTKFWDHNYKDIWASQEDINEVVDYLNKNISSIEIKTLGGTKLETFTPKAYSDDNKLINSDGTFNKDYLAQDATTQKGRDELHIFRNVARFLPAGEQKLYVIANFTGTNPRSVQIIYPENMPTSNKATEDGSYKLYTSGRFMPLFLKLKMEDDGVTVKSLEDNNTPAFGGSGNYWSVTYMDGDGLGKFAGKNLEEIKRLDMGRDKGDSYGTSSQRFEKGPDAVAGATGTSMDVKEAVVAFLEKLKAKSGEQVDKKALLAEIKKADEIIKDADNDEYVNNQALKDLREKHKKAKEILAKKNATEQEVATAKDDLKTAIENKSLKRYPADKDALEIAIDNANAINKTDYTDESVASLEAAVKKGQEVFRDNDAKQKDVDTAREAIEKAVKRLEEKESEDVKWFTITGKLVRYGSEDDPSMSGPALNPTIRVKEKEGKTTYYLQFKPIEPIPGLKSQIEDLNHFDKSVKKAVEDIRLIDGEYNKEFVFTRDAQDETSIHLQLGARMGGPDLSYPDVTLKLDLTNKNKKKPKLEITEDIKWDLEKLQESINIGKDKLEGLENDEYTIEEPDKSLLVKRLKEAIAKGQEQHDNPTSEDDIYNAKTAINKLHYDLQLKPVNVQPLKDLMDQVKDILKNENIYTDESVANLKKVLADAQNKYDVSTDSISGNDIREKYIDKAWSDLFNAMSNLEEKPSEKPQPQPNPEPKPSPEPQPNPAPDQPKDNNDVKIDDKLPAGTKVYEVEGHARKFDDPDSASMLDNWVNKKVKIYENNGETTYEVTFLPFNNSSESISEMTVIDGSTKIIGKLKENKDYNTTFTFKRNKTGEDSFLLEVKVKPMGNDLKKVYLKMDLATKKLVAQGKAMGDSTDKPEAKPGAKPDVIPSPKADDKIGSKAENGSKSEVNDNKKVIGSKEKNSSNRQGKSKNNKVKTGDVGVGEASAIGGLALAGILAMLRRKKD